MSALAFLMGAFFGAALVTWLCVPFVLWLTKRLGWIDLPGGRHIHEQPTPRGGGLAIFLGLLAGSGVYGAAFGWEWLIGVFSIQQLTAFFAPCLLVFLVGLIDDARGLSPVPKLLAEAVAAAFLIQAGYVIDSVALPNGTALDLGLLGYPITMLWVLGVTNAFNLIDGIDGLLATVGMLALLGCAAVGLWAGMLGTPALALALAGALLGFLPWNWHPAKIFLGDSGSLLVGFTLAAWSLKVSRNINGAMSFHIPLLLCALPLVEMALTLARRYVSGERFMEGDQSHIHHVLLKKGLPAPRAVLLLGAVGFLFASAAFFSRSWQRGGPLVTVCVLLLLALGGLRYLGYLELRLLWDRFRQAIRQPRRGLPVVLKVARAGNLISRATTWADLGELLEQARDDGEFTSLTITLRPEWALAARADEADAVLSVSAPEDSDRETTAVQHTLPLWDGETRIGDLVCLRHHDLHTPTPSARDIQRYLVEPLARVLVGLGGAT